MFRKTVGPWAPTSKPRCRISSPARPGLRSRRPGRHETRPSDSRRPTGPKRSRKEPKGGLGNFRYFEEEKHRRKLKFLVVIMKVYVYLRAKCVGKSQSPYVSMASRCWNLFRVWSQLMGRNMQQKHCMPAIIHHLPDSCPVVQQDVGLWVLWASKWV